MSLFKNIFGSNTSKSDEKEQFINLTPLNSLSQLEELKELSENEAVLIFKHSTRCGISRNVLRKFENTFDDKLSKLKVYYLDLLSYRNISNTIAHDFNVTHQSPQLLIIKDGISIADASHYDILNINLKEYIISQ